MREGLYEHVVTAELERSLDSVQGLEAELSRVDEADQSHVLTRHIAKATPLHLVQSLESLREARPRAKGWPT